MTKTRPFEQFRNPSQDKGDVWSSYVYKCLKVLSNLKSFLSEIAVDDNSSTYFLQMSHLLWMKHMFYLIHDRLSRCTDSELTNQKDFSMKAG